MHPTKQKGDLAVAKVICDLIEKGYDPFIPVVTEHLPFDIIAYKDGHSIRIQSKYSANGHLNGTSGPKKYNDNDFDYYAAYLPTVSKVIYPSIKFRNCKIRIDIPNSAMPFYWWEDFLELTTEAVKRTYLEFGKKITRPLTEEQIIARRKIVRPSKDELERLIWSKPLCHLAKDFGVSDRAIVKWIKRYGLEQPPRGYWNTHAAEA